MTQVHLSSLNSVSNLPRNLFPFTQQELVLPMGIVANNYCSILSYHTYTPPPPTHTHTSITLAADPVKVDKPQGREEPQHGEQKEKQSHNQQGLPDPKESQL